MPIDSQLIPASILSWASRTPGSSWSMTRRRSIPSTSCTTRSPAKLDNRLFRLRKWVGFGKVLRGSSPGRARAHRLASVHRAARTKASSGHASLPLAVKPVPVTGLTDLYLHCGALGSYSRLQKVGIWA